MNSLLQRIEIFFGHPWYEIGKDYGLPMGLGIFALISAYFIFYKETRRDKETENQNKEQERKDKLLFFSSMIRSVISISKQMESNITAFIEKIKQDPVHVHLLEFVPFHDLRRITLGIDIEKYMLAYVEEFSQNRKQSISDFGMIISKIDFLYELFLGLPSQLQKSQEFYHQRASKIQSKQQEADEIITSYLATQSLPENLHKLMNETHNAFHENTAGQNHELALYDTHFFKAFNDLCVSVIDNGFQMTPTFKRLIELTRDARGIFKYIQVEHLELSNDFTEQLKQAQEATEKLKSLSTNLLQNS